MASTVAPRSGEASPPAHPRRNLRTLYAASFLNDLGADMIYPIWPLFVTTVLGANMAVLGLIDGLGDAIVSLSQAASGYLSDRLGRRKVFIWLGYACGSLSRAGYAISASWSLLLPFRALDRAGKIRSAPRDAIIADESTPRNRGHNFGWLRAMDNLGALCGVLVCLALLGPLGYRGLLWLAALPSLASVALILLLLREHRPTQARIFKGLSLRALGRDLRLLTILSACFALGAFSYSFLLILAHRSGFRAGTVPVLYLLFTAVAALTSLPFGRLSDRVGRRAVLHLGYIFWGLTCLALILTRHTAGIVAAFVLYGLHRGALDPVQRALVAELAPPGLRASSLGGFQMVVGLCALPASLLAGVLWERAGVLAPLSVSLALTALAALLLLFVREPGRGGARIPGATGAA